MISLAELLESSIIKSKKDIAICECEKGCYSYDTLKRDANSLYLYWKSTGLSSEAKIGICASSCYYWIVVFIAAVLNDKTIVILPENNTEESIEKLIEHSEIELLYTTSKLYQNLTIAQTQLIEVIDIETRQILLSRAEKNKKRTIHSTIPESYLIMYSSGSSGHIKGVILPYKSISFDVSNAIKTLPYNNHSKYLSVLPFSHLTGLVYDVLAPLCSGMSIHILGTPPSPRFILPALTTISPYFFVAVPFIIDKIIDYIQNNNSKTVTFDESHPFGHHCKMIITGGGPISQETISSLERLTGITHVSGYGMTECTTISLGCLQNYKPMSCGKCLDGVLVKTSTGKHSEGEIYVKSPGLFWGYYKDPQLTSHSFTQDGWFKTGDIGYIDSDGFVYLKGRSKEVLITATGLNIYPDDIEKVINRLSEVIESIVIQRENHLVALVYLSDDSLDVSFLYRVNKQLPTYCIISKFEKLDSPLERTKKGTIKRYLYK